jgi:hypothetical protein
MQTSHPRVIRSRIIIALYWLLGVGAFAIAACCAMMTIYEWFLEKHRSFFSIFGGAQWGVGAWSFWLLGRQMFRVAARTFNQ